VLVSYSPLLMVPTPMEQAQGINYLGFNQDQTCLAVGTLYGFKIFSTEGFKLLHEEACGAVSVVEMLFRTSLLALVGCASTKTPSSSSRALTMWNTKDRCNICQLHFNAQIHAVKMNHRRIAVLLSPKIHIFDLKTMKSLHVIDRSPSPWANPALGWLCASTERGYLATPLALAGSAPLQCSGQGAHSWSAVHHHSSTRQECSSISPGQTIYDRSFRHSCSQLTQGAGYLEAQLGLVTVVDTYTLKPIGTVLAHRSPVQALCLNPTGQLLATASAKGTVIRLFAVPTLDMLFSFRRGTSACRIFGLTFSRDSAQICASAASGTVHIFKNSEKVLGGLPLQSEDATVGAAQREMISQASQPIAKSRDEPTPEEEAKLRAASPALPMAPIKLGPTSAPTVPNRSDAALFEIEAEDLEDWNVVAERPERLLELCMDVPSYGSYRTTKNTLQTLSAVSEKAVENTAKYAKSLLQLLPQPCRELVDAHRAFAWVHLRDEEFHRTAGDVPETGGSDLWLSKLPPLAETEGQGMYCGYAACISSRSSAMGHRPEVLVATAEGCAHIYDFNSATGGECRLRSEHCFMPQHPDPEPVQRFTTFS